MTSKETGGDECTKVVLLETINGLSLSEKDEIEKNKSLEDLKCELVNDSNLTMEKKMYKIDFEVPDWLQDFESPFSWQLEVETRVFHPEFVIKRILRRLEELSVENPAYTSKRSMQLLKLVVEFYIMNQEQECWEKIKEIEVTLNKAKEEARVKEDHPYNKIGRALDHIVYVTKAYLKVLNGQEKEARKILEGVTPVNTLSNEEKVYLYLRKADYFVSFDCRSFAVKFHDKALELEPDNVNAIFSKAKSLRELRRDFLFSLEVPDEEITLIKRAIEISDDLHKKVYLAQGFREYADTMMKTYKKTQGFYNSDTFKTVQHFHKEALRIYIEALKENPVNPDNDRVLRRVGYGIIKLPRSMISPEQYKMAVKCLHQALEISECAMSLQVLADYYSRIGNDKEKALDYLERSIVKFKSDQALFFKVQIKFQMDPYYDPIPDLTIGLGLDIYKKSNVVEIWAQMGSYFLFIKRDLIKSLGAFTQALIDSYSLNHLKAFKAFFLHLYDPINLPEYLANECKLFKTVDVNELSGDEKSNHAINLTLVQEFYDKIIKLEPDLAQVKVKTDLIDDLLKLSDINKKNKERRERGYEFRQKKLNQQEKFKQDWRKESMMNWESGTEKNASIGKYNKQTQWERVNERKLNTSSPYHQQRRPISHTAGYSGQDSFNNEGRELNDYFENNYRYRSNDQQNRGSCQNRRDQSFENWRQK